MAGNSLNGLKPSSYRPAPVAAICAMLATLTLATFPGTVAGQDTSQPTTVSYLKGRILVKAKAGVDDKGLDKELAIHGGKRIGRLKQIGVDIIELPPNASETAVVKALSRNPRFKFAELDVVVAPRVTTNDPLLPNQWHHGRIGALTAWESSRGANVVVAVLDTGVDGDHPDLAAQLVPGWNVYDNTADTSDVYGHGTPVAGTVAGIGNNAVGVAGVAWSARIMPVRISRPDGMASLSAMASGILWAADHGAKVANISYEAAGSSTVANAAEYLRAKGGVLVIAAGNTGGQTSYAASSSYTVVSATDSADNRASWSSYGASVDMAAPGTGIPTTALGGGYANESGTSFAAPIVAGVYALMIAANPRMSAAELDRTMFSTALDRGAAGFDAMYGYGRVDAARAVMAALQSTATDTTGPSVSISNPSAGERLSGIVGVEVSATDPSGVASADLMLNGSVVATDIGAPFAFSLDTSRFPDGPATLQVRAKDAVGNSGTSASVGVTIANDTTKPSVSITSPAQGAVVSGSVTVSASASDNVRVTKLSLSIDGREVAISYGSTLSYSWSASTVTVKGNGKKRSGATSTTSSTLTVRAEDAAGNSSTATVTVQR